MLDEGKLGVRGGEVGLKKALNPKKKIPFALKEKISLSHNTRLFRFALQSPEHQLGLPTGQHMFFYCKVSPCVQSVAALPATSTAFLQHLTQSFAFQQTLAAGMSVSTALHMQ